MFGGDYFTSVEAKDESRRIGMGLELNHIIQQRWGAAGRYLFLDAKDDLFAVADRDEHRIEVELNFLGYSGINLGFKHIFRSINLDNRDSSGETVNSTNASLSYLLPNRAMKFTVEGRNLADNNYNWVTDRFDLTGEIPERNWRARLEFNF
jgi:hypothetical protein